MPSDNRVALPVRMLALALLLALVAFASRHPIGTRTHILATGVLRDGVDALAVLGTATAVCVGAVIVASLASGYRRRRKDEPDWVEWRLKAPLSAQLLGLGVLLAVAAAIAIAILTLHPAGNTAPLSISLRPHPRPGAGIRPLQPAGSSGGPPLWIICIPLGLVALLAACYWGWSAQLRRRDTSRSRISLDRRQVAVLDRSLADLDEVDDPREAVIRSYDRMARELASLEVEIDRSEAPREYMRRVLGTLGDDVPEVVHLTGLYEEARFSEHAIGEPQREDATGALRRLRDRIEAGERAPGAAGNQAGGHSIDGVPAR